MRPDSPCNYWIQRFDTRTGELIEKPRQLTNWVGLWMNAPSATADSKHVAFLESSGRGTSYVADLEAGGTRLASSRRFTLEEGGDDAITDWGGDSKSAIVVLNRGDHYSLRKQSLNSDRQETIVTSAPGSIEDAMVSPDGKWVIAHVYPVPGPSAQEPLMRVPITGGLPELIFTVRPSSQVSCARSPSNLCAVTEQTQDRKQMIITSFDPVKGRGPELARLDINPDLDLNLKNLLSDISPDGKRLAVAPGPEGPIQIRSLLSHSSQVIHAKGVAKMLSLSWSADGKGFFVTNVTTTGGEILHVDLQGNAKVLWKCNSDRCFGGQSPDGRHIAIYDWKLSANMWMMQNF
jgi:hypothetical protein